MIEKTVVAAKESFEVVYEPRFLIRNWKKKEKKKGWGGKMETEEDYKESIMMEKKWKKFKTPCGVVDSSEINYESPNQL